MSDYRHELRKFADQGLQLRLPVDLIPPTQYGRLTNATPVIEGQLITRDGLTQLGVSTEVCFCWQLARANTGTNLVTIAYTNYPSGYRVGDPITLDVLALNPGEASSLALQAYTGQTVTGVTTTTSNTVTGPTVVGAGANDGSANVAWTNPNNVTSAVFDASVTLTQGQQSQGLVATGLGFSIPTNVVIQGIVVSLTHGGPSVTSIQGQLLKAGVPTGGLRTDGNAAPTSTLGGPSDLWGTTWTPADINNANFGVDLTAFALSLGSAGTSTVRNVRFTIYGSIPNQPTVTFTPGFNATWSGTNLTLEAFTEITSANQPNDLANTVITNIFRLNEALANVSTQRLVAIGGRIWYAPVSGGAFQELISPLAPGGIVPVGLNNLSGRPLSIISFRFTKDTPSWAIIADPKGMLKYRPGATITSAEFVALGNAPPTEVATASAGGVGNLNSTGGPGYDWRYTYVDGLALTESNPSPVTTAPGTTTTIPPTSETNPAVSGQTAFTNVTATGGAAFLNAAASNGTSVQIQASCLWKGFVQPAGTIDAQTLQFTLNVSQNVTSSQSSGGSMSANVTYSYDGGATFQGAFNTGWGGGGGASSSGPSTNKTFTFTIPSSVSPTNVIVRADASASASAAPGNQATAYIAFSISGIGLVATVEASTVTLALANQSANVCVTPSPLPQHTFINLYRRGGSLPDNWRLVGQFQVSTLVQGGCGVGTLQINDNVSDTTLSTSLILELDNDQPVTSVTAINQALSFVWGPAGVEARVLGCGDPARPECVYFSKPGNADAWPPQNFIEVCDPGTPVIAGCVFNTRNFAFSQEGIYELVEGLGTGTTYTPFRTPASRGLFTPWGLAIGPAMYFISKDGIYESIGNQEQSIVENDIKPIFPTYDSPGQTIEGYEAVDYAQPDLMRLRYHSNELYFIYSGVTTGTLQMLIYDVLKKRWRAAKSSVQVSEVYSEPATTQSLLEGTVSGVVYQAGGNFDPTELDLLNNVSVTTTNAASAFSTAVYHARVSGLSSAGEVALSYDIPNLSVSPSVSLQVIFPAAPTGIVGWRVYYGPDTAIESQYTAFTEAQVAAALNRTVVISAPGSAGSPPLVNASSNINVLLRTGAHDQGMPLNQKQYSNVIFDLDPGGATVAAPVTITPYINGEAQANVALTVTGSGRQQVPLNLSDYFAFNTEYEIKWSRTSVSGGAVSNPILYQYDTLWYPEPVSVVHWQSQPTSFEFPGYVHCRDAYIAIRSTAAVTLTMTIDGTVVQTYTIPSTNGQRLKQYIQFASNKGLVYKFALDSTTSAQFRVYASDLEVRVKPWLGLLGYSVQKPVGGEAQ